MEAVQSNIYALGGKRSNSFVTTDKTGNALTDESDAQTVKPIAGLAAHVKLCFKKAEEHKTEKSIDDILTACLEQRRGRYTAEEKARFGGVDVYRNVTGVIVRSAIALISDTYFSAADRPFTIEATPLPELPEISRRAVEIAVTDVVRTAVKNGSQIDPSKAMKQLTETALEIAQEEVRSKSKAMERKIEDQLLEGNWRTAFAEFISDVCTFPVGVIKGPIVKNVKTAKWYGNQLMAERQPRLTVERVSPFDIYPSPDSTDTQDGEYFIERMRMPRGKLSDCRTLPNFRKEAIELLLHERELEQASAELPIDVTRGNLEKVAKDHNTVEIYDFWGRVSGRSIVEFFEKSCEGEEAETKSREVDTDWGKIDPYADYEINVWLAGDYIIRAMLNPSPLGSRPYHSASFAMLPGSFWGEGIPELLKDLQNELNAAARARIYNLGFASGPVVEIDVEQFEEGQVPQKITPWDLIYVRGSGVSTGKPAMRFYQASSNSAELGAIMQEAYSKAFEITGIPPYMQGFNQGAARTLGAFSMQFANALKGIKQVISNVDRGAIEPIVEQFYYFNLFYTDDETIKADAKVKARGAEGIMAQEQKQARPLETIHKLGPLLEKASPGALPNLVGEYMKQSGYDPGTFGLPGSTSQQELSRFAGPNPQNDINLQPPPLDGRSAPAINAMRDSGLPAPV